MERNLHPLVSLLIGKRCVPIALDSAAQFRSPPPPLFGSDQLAAEVAEVVAMQTNLSTWNKKDW